MTIRHHPDDSMLIAFAAGTLDLGQHAAIATHLAACPRCRRLASAMEHVGGAVLENLPPAPMAGNALERVMARLPEIDRAAEREPSPEMAAAEIPGLPKFIRKYPIGEWQWVAPRVHLRRITLPEPSRTRVFLLRSGPGTKMLQHSHTGIEMTCVLSGAFKHEGGHFGPGDFDLGDATVDHQPMVDDGEDCVCLVAMQGDLRLNGILGRVMQPFVRL
ncbi:MAG: ChrR family anti-sigma-E factor [Xanthobacteraceae bacterium]|nr:ChrR family anti-sigma-E factor [Xanthobacteraceae bacterium]